MNKSPQVGTPSLVVVCRYHGGIPGTLGLGSAEVLEYSGLGGFY